MLLPCAAKDGVVLATEKKMASALMDEASVEKIAMVTDHVGVVYSGIGPDFRVLVAKARKRAVAYKRAYGVSARMPGLLHDASRLAHEPGAPRARRHRSPSRCCSWCARWLP